VGELPISHGDIYYDFHLSIENLEDKMEYECNPKWKCKVLYNPKVTPVLYDTIPSNIYNGQKIQFMMQMRRTHAKEGTPSDAPPFESLRLGDKLLITEYEKDFRLPDW